MNAITPWLAAALIFMALPAQAAPTCRDRVQPSGALYRTCFPDTWNGRLVVYAHGYVDPFEPIQIPVESPFVEALFTDLGYAYTTTSYRVNGLAVTQGVEDLQQLIRLFEQSYGTPVQTYLTGISEGGLIATLTTEQAPTLIDGTLAMCGPIGDFKKQIDYQGDFFVVFDYFFPGLVPGSVAGVPQILIDNWDAYYENIVQPVVFDPANADKLAQLLNVTKVPTTNAEESVALLLWFNVFANNDAKAKLGGQGFSNIDRVYRGSNNDTLLNQRIQRVRANPQALAEIQRNYETRGTATVPLVTLHTTQDPLVPFWHEALYGQKAVGVDLTTNPIARYGHCLFSPNEILEAFDVLVQKVEGP